MRARKPGQIHVHFVGIGGIGMSGIAEVLHNQNYKVSGSDLSASETTRHLESVGVPVRVGHRAENIQGASVVVISSAVKADNPEVMAARQAHVPVIPRAEMLGELMRGKTGIAVAGTHGKTTTTSMMAAILANSGEDPTIVVGGRVNTLGGNNSKLGRGEYVVAEADESDGSFTHLPATYSIITNVDNDHLDHFGSLEGIDRAFIEFASKIPFYGVNVVCGDDPGVQRCLGKVTKPFVTYGLSGEPDYLAKNVVRKGLGSEFEVMRRQGPGKSYLSLGVAKIWVPGLHNVSNALAAFSLSHQMGVQVPDIITGLEHFKGVRRRFDIRWKSQDEKTWIVDDYGHHPTEIQATLKAARSVWNGRIVVVFQPHRYSRTQSCFEGFRDAFLDADELYISEIYAAGEEPIEGVSGFSLASSIHQKKAKFISDLSRASEFLAQEIRTGDLVLCMGAGSITKLPDALAQALQAKGMR